MSNCPLPVAATIVILAFASLLAESCTNKAPSESGWKTFTNSKYAYTFQYPAREWEVLGTAGDVKESSYVSAQKGGSIFTVQAFENPRDLPARQWYDEEAKTATKGAFPWPEKIVREKTDVTVNGAPAFKVSTTDDGNSCDYFISGGGYVYILQFEQFATVNDVGGQPGVAPHDVFDRILNSFTFKK